MPHGERISNKQHDIISLLADHPSRSSKTLDWSICDPHFYTILYTATNIVTPLVAVGD